VFLIHYGLKGFFVRFDDMLATVNAHPTDESGALAAAWMQTIDILAQQRGSINAEQRKHAFARLNTLRSRVPVDRRRAIAAGLAARPLSADTVAFLGADAPVVAAPVLMTVDLSVADWERILPRLPQPSRALLRERRDLPESIKAILSGLGAQATALPAREPAENAFAGAPIGADKNEAERVGTTQISDLVDRIEDFRRHREANLAGATRSAALNLSDTAKESVTAFRFETAIDGVILWIDDGSRGAVIGMSISVIAEVGMHGVDGHAAGAFRKRTPFRNARLSIPGTGEMAGVWLISGTPWFDAEHGRFQGYRGSARRPTRDEYPVVPRLGLLGEGLPPDSVRQLVHELRTPLNAIRGFAEMIDSQLLGPVAMAYRDRAQAIIEDSRRLLWLFDDLDSAAKLDRGDHTHGAAAHSDARRLLSRVATDLTAMTEARDIHLRIVAGNDHAALAVDQATAERMYARLLSTVVGLAAPAEMISAHLLVLANRVTLTVDRPQSLAGRSEQDLLDPGFAPVGNWPDGPALGLGFALRLIANMARAAGGQLIVSDGDIALMLPAPADTATNGVLR
jgi:His Kinase A (phospho-acceptor) domain